MKKALYLLVAIVLTSCTNTDPNEQLQNLTGYWTIEKVEVENDSVVEYSLSQYIDYIESKDILEIKIQSLNCGQNIDNDILV